mmetsp:Transcript_7098/g.23341  ORF Transcript_7098/g.23341 Transcript_7098/m.23341 type:complete len:106 (+) Transcript_7098:147-464(+)
MARQDADWEMYLGREDVVFVDCRNDDEVAKGALPKYVHLPCRMTEDPAVVVAKCADLLPSKATPLVVFCAVGGRSARVQKALQTAGWQAVKNGGGFDAVKAKLMG